MSVALDIGIFFNFVALISLSLILHSFTKISYIGIGELWWFCQSMENRRSGKRPALQSSVFRKRSGISQTARNTGLKELLG